MFFLLISVPIRLVGGTGPHEGRLEVYYKGKWGTVADTIYFGRRGAEMVCRQLGFPGPAVATKSSVFGMGSGHIAIRLIDCSEYDKVLEDCVFITENMEVAKHVDDVGVACNSKFYFFLSLVIHCSKF